jgi:hypothetical protein
VVTSVGENYRDRSVIRLLSGYPSTALNLKYQ